MQRMKGRSKEAALVGDLFNKRKREQEEKTGTITTIVVVLFL